MFGKLEKKKFNAKFTLLPLEEGLVKDIKLFTEPEVAGISQCAMFVSVCVCVCVCVSACCLITFKIVVKTFHKFRLTLGARISTFIVILVW